MQSRAFIILHLTRPSAISFPPTSLLPSRFPTAPPVSPRVSPGQLRLSVPGLSTRMAALPECILRQPTHSSVATEARCESQIRYLTKRAAAEQSRSVGGMCGSLTKGNLTDPPVFPSGKQTAISTPPLFQRNNCSPTTNIIAVEDSLDK